MKTFVTGAAGFIGSNVVDRVLALGASVAGVDNLSTGRSEFLDRARQSAAFHFERGDLLEDQRLLEEAMEGADVVFHLAANADVRFGPEQPRKDLEQNTIVTSNVLEAMRRTGVKRIVFASTGSVYGEPEVFPTPENAPFPIQTSLYAASKLAAEGMIAAYSEAYGIESYLFRFVSILGERYTHGHVIDFYRQLREHPDRLHVLGDGKQRKSYLYVQDCISAILTCLDRAHEKINLYNLGTNEYCKVNDSIGWICEHLGLHPQMTYAGGERGWVGDSPFIFLDCSKIRSLGWKPEVSIRDAVIQTVKYIGENPLVLGQAA